MKNRLFSVSKAQFPVLAWIFFHALILGAFLISLAVSPKITFATSLFEILPPSSALHEVQAADSALGAKTSRAVTILAKSDSFETAKSAAATLYSQYVDSENRVNSDFFESLSLFVDSASVSEITAWLHKNRFVLLDDETRTLLENSGATEIAEGAIASVYGAFTLSDLSTLEEDPFLLTERNLKKLLEDGAISSTAMSLHDDVLACQKDGDWFVLIRGVVSEKGAALASKKSTVKSIYDVATEILRHAQNDNVETQHDADSESRHAEPDRLRYRGRFVSASENDGRIEFIFSGVPFHSYESSTSAQAQISVISTVALVLIVVVFLWIFRSIVPALVSALAVAFSCAIGFVSTLLFFRGIHVLTFVFGTTLIGTCLDYSIHYFVNWKANLDCDSGTTVRKHIFRGITLGFASTEICFAALFLAPFPLLKQVSVFLFTGLATAYLSVVALYPMLKMPKNRKTVILNLFQNQKEMPKELRHDSLARIGKFRVFIPLIFVLFALVVISTNYRSLKIHNNIQELYSMSPQMLQNEITSAQVLNTGSSGWYFILKADSQESLLQKNEELGEFLNKSASEGKLGSFLSVSQFIPSEKTQRASFDSAQNLLPFVSQQYEALGFDSSAHHSSDSEMLVSQFITNYRSLENHFVHPNDSHLPATIKDAIANLWIGEIDDEFYSCVLPLHAKPEEEQFFREYASQTDGIYFVNKVRDISNQLDILSKAMLKMLALAFVAVIAILFFCYKPRLVFKIATVPLIVMLVTTAILLLCKIHLSFFPITALVLVFGLGLDYIIYAIEGSKENAKDEKQTNGSSQNLNNFAILLSFVTTALSFGALVLSTFPPVHMLGLTVFAGLSTAVVTALLER